MIKAKLIFKHVRLHLPVKNIEFIAITGRYGLVLFMQFQNPAYQFFISVM